MEDSTAKDLEKFLSESQSEAASSDIALNSSGADILAQQYDIKDLGDPDTLCSTILQLVAEGKYERAIKELRGYQEVKNHYPQYEGRTTRYFDHCEELISAVKSKKNFPAVTNLPMSKQQELEDRVREHFNDLKKFLQRIGQIERDLRVQDARSTIWVFQTLLVCVGVVFVVAVTKEALLTLGTPVEVILEDLIAWLTSFLD